MERAETLKEKIKKALKSQSSPSELALGAALGAFIGILPVYGFHLLLWILFSFLVPRANKVAIFLGTNVSLPPTVPLITWTGYEIGRRILGAGKYPPLDFAFFRHFALKKIGSFYFPLFVGSVILGIICAVILYGIIYAAVTARQRHAHKQR